MQTQSPHRPDSASLIAGVMTDRTGRELHVRVHGLPNLGEPFNYFAKDKAQRDDFIRRYTARGFRAEIVVA